ncbi:hypothetical protein EGW08_010554 [Elysia chlorotica]|uniref:Uncharacterized protein n=1 Tax=Elysia chlorotica TaxID=188477 RepID=A0A433TJD3_ELYCH|nr:hypothetical protein EGW08_010554 [Elysia chlorotica]
MPENLRYRCWNSHLFASALAIPYFSDLPYHIRTNLRLQKTQDFAPDGTHTGNTMGCGGHVLMLVSLSILGSLGLTIDTISSGPTLTAGTDPTPSSIMLNRLGVNQEIRGPTSSEIPHLHIGQQTELFTSQSSDKAEPNQESDYPTSSLSHRLKGPWAQASPVSSDNVMFPVTSPPPSSDMSILEQLAKLLEDQARPQLLDQILGQREKLEILLKRGKREAVDEENEDINDESDDDDNDEDEDSSEDESKEHDRVGHRLRAARTSRTSQPSTASPPLTGSTQTPSTGSPPTKTTVSMTPPSESLTVTLSAQTRHAQHRTLAASSVTQPLQETTPTKVPRRLRTSPQTQQETTPTKVPRRLRTSPQTQQETTPTKVPRRQRSTASYTRRCPSVSELKRILSQMSRYSQDEIRNVINCVDLQIQRRRDVRTTPTTVTTTTPTPRRSRSHDVDYAKARDMLIVG